MIVGDKIKELRLERSWSQSELAAKSGINPKMISRYELGLAQPTLTGLMKLADVFDVSTDYLLFGKTRKKSIGDRELFDLFKKVEIFGLENKKLAKGVIRCIIAKNEQD